MLTPADLPTHGLLPRFSHRPPSSIPSARRWPSSLDPQAFPPSSVPTLADVVVWATPYLLPVECAKLRQVGHVFRHGSEYGPLWFTKPWSPNRRRRWGFGIPSKERTVVSDTPPAHLFLHFAWQFLAPADQARVVPLCSQWFLYHQLRVRAIRRSVAILHHRRPPPSSPKKLPMDRALLYACSLLRFNFNYGDFLRWLGG